MNWAQPARTIFWRKNKNQEKVRTLRVDELFKDSPETGILTDKPTVLSECLVFVTLSTNMLKAGNKLIMGNHPTKHVGILYQGKVWNYSNSHNKVVADPLETFKMKFTHAYKTSGATVEFYYGKFI